MYNESHIDLDELSPENVELSLSKILYCLTAASFYLEYSHIKKEIDSVLEKFMIIISKYTNNPNIKEIDFKLIDEIAIKVSNLDYKTLSNDGLFFGNV